MHVKMYIDYFYFQADLVICCFFFCFFVFLLFILIRLTSLNSKQVDEK